MVRDYIDIVWKMQYSLGNTIAGLKSRLSKLSRANNKKERVITRKFEIWSELNAEKILPLFAITKTNYLFCQQQKKQLLVSSRLRKLTNFEKRLIVSNR